MSALISKPLPLQLDTPLLSRLLLALALCLVLPSHAAPQSPPRKASADKQAKPAKAKRTAVPKAVTSTPVPARPEAASAGPALPTPRPAPPVVVAAPTSPAPAAPAALATGATPSPAGTTASGTATVVTAPATNPYLAGWYVPTPVNDLPRLAAQQLTVSAQWTYANVINLPGNLIDALPRIKRVFPTGGRELWVVNLKCPAEMLTGQYFLPANALRDAVNGLLVAINEMRLLKFDIQLVCS